MNPLSSLKGFTQQAEAKLTNCHGFAEAENSLLKNEPNASF